jgi:hypothetical protein
MSLFFRDFESLGQYHDFWATILLSAPDEFRSYDDREIDQKAALEEAFEVLRSGFHFAERKVKEPRAVRIMRELIEMAQEAYRAGDTKTGAHTLQECEGMIWPSYRQRAKYAVEAERRAFGEVVTYAGVTVSPYPYEGSEQDLTDSQSLLYAAARTRCLDHLAQEQDFKPFVLLLEADGTVRELNSRSWKKAKDEIRDLVAQGKVLGFVRAQATPSGMHGIVIYQLEAPNAPQVSVRSLVRNYQSDSPRFHLDDPSVLGDHA